MRLKDFLTSRWAHIGKPNSSKTEQNISKFLGESEQQTHTRQQISYLAQVRNMNNTHSLTDHRDCRSVNAEKWKHFPPKDKYRPTEGGHKITRLHCSTPQAFCICGQLAM